MAKNDPQNPQLARKSQDVEAAPRRPSYGEGHYGRGKLPILPDCCLSPFGTVEASAYV